MQICTNALCIEEWPRNVLTGDRQNTVAGEMAIRRIVPRLYCRALALTAQPRSSSEASLVHTTRFRGHFHVKTVQPFYRGCFQPRQRHLFATPRASNTYNKCYQKPEACQKQHRALQVCFATFSAVSYPILHGQRHCATTSWWMISRHVLVLWHLKSCVKYTNSKKNWFLYRYTR